MTAYIVRRLALMIPTLFGILLVAFIVAQAAPGGPVERIIAQLSGANAEATARFTGGGGEVQAAGSESAYRGARGLDPQFIAELEKQFGFDQPAWRRFVLMAGDYVRFDFGASYYRDVPVVQLILEKMPVSVSLGLWTTLLVYMISIPLGVAKARRAGSAFDIWSSTLIIFFYAIPGFLLAILLIVLLAGGSFFDIFPLRGLTSDTWDDLSFTGKIADYFWHITLPVFCLAIGSLTTTALLTRNSFLDEISKHYVQSARAKGAGERRILYRHVFRNAMLIIIAGFPGAFIGAFFTGALLIETIFSLDGLGLLSYSAIIDRDYPVVFATLYIFGLLGLVITLISDLTYMWIDPRIDFAARG